MPTSQDIIELIRQGETISAAEEIQDLTHAETLEVVLDLLEHLGANEVARMADVLGEMEAPEEGTGDLIHISRE